MCIYVNVVCCLTVGSDCVVDLGHGTVLHLCKVVVTLQNSTNDCPTNGSVIIKVLGVPHVVWPYHGHRS